MPSATFQVLALLGLYLCRRIAQAYGGTILTAGYRLGVVLPRHRTT